MLLNLNTYGITAYLEMDNILLTGSSSFSGPFILELFGFQ
jgi:hypothetical protein